MRLISAKNRWILPKPSKNLWICLILSKNRCLKHRFFALFRQSFRDVTDARPSTWETVATGAILVNSKAYGRYAGELSIARGLLELDARDNVAGSICEEDRAFLPYIHSGHGFRFIRR